LRRAAAHIDRTDPGSARIRRIRFISIGCDREAQRWFIAESPFWTKLPFAESAHASLMAH
jgi:hypothetical protein